MLIYEITVADIGKRFITSWAGRLIALSGVMGYVLSQDIGKRLYQSHGVVSVENNEQRNQRV